MAKNQINVEISDTNQTQTISLVGDVTIREVASRILSLAVTEPTEAEVVTNFLKRTGLSLIIETPDSSWVEAVRFDADRETITFLAEDGAEIPYSTSFEDFLEDLEAPSFGRLQWKYKRGQR